MGPLVSVLRLVDNEKKPAMGYIYRAMDVAKNTIKELFKSKEDKYKKIFEIIDQRWRCQLHHPLHAAGLYLNPEYFYDDPSIQFDARVSSGLVQCIERLSRSEEIQDKITSELQLYKAAHLGPAAGYDNDFASRIAQRQRKTLSPANWWGMYGNKTPDLQALAIKILSLTCSSSGCERNWSTFEHIHSKKRSRLEHQRLNDLVFIKYNQTLKERKDISGTIDPISIDIYDGSSEWLTGDVELEDNEGEGSLVNFDDVEEVVDDENGEAFWKLIDEASGASEALLESRTRSSKSKSNYASTSKSASCSSKSKSKGKQVVEDIEELEEEEEELYVSEGEGNGDEEVELEDDDD